MQATDSKPSTKLRPLPAKMPKRNPERWEVVPHISILARYTGDREIASRIREAMLTRAKLPYS